jgi:excisionase family DNA binding protein
LPDEEACTFAVRTVESTEISKTAPGSDVKRTILSTADIARMFSVTETTVKRWADEGSLRCHKTPGGHRKFEMRHVVEFAEQNNFDPVGTLEVVGGDRISDTLQLAVLSRDFDALVREFIERALSPSRSDLYTFLSFLYEHRVHLWEIFDLVVAPGMKEIGERWARGEIGIGHEHMASYETLEALAKMQSRISIKPAEGHAVVLAALGEEQHEIGLRCSSYLFEAEGWATHYLGARTPANAVVSALQEITPAVVCLSISQPEHILLLREALEAVGTAARGVNAEIIVGGRAATPDLLPGTEGLRIVSSSKGLLEFIHHFKPDTSGKALIQNRPPN